MTDQQQRESEPNDRTTGGIERFILWLMFGWWVMEVIRGANQ